jgi:hypothetical protein
MSKEQIIKAKELLAKGIRPKEVSKRLVVPLLEIRTLHRKLNKAEHRNLQEDKQRLIELSSNFTVQALERLNREVNTMDINRLAISFGIVIDKQQLLQGQATARIETTKGLSQEQLLAMLESMKKANAKEIEAETCPVEPSPQLPESPSKAEALDARFADPSSLAHQRNLREYEASRHWTGEP